MTGKGVAESRCRDREWPTGHRSPPGKEASAVRIQERVVIIKKSGRFEGFYTAYFLSVFFCPWSRVVIIVRIRLFPLSKGRSFSIGLPWSLFSRWFLMSR